MDFSLSTEQQMLKDSAERFLRGQYTFEVRRTIVNSETGFRRAHWSSMAELGWLMLNIDGDHGGLGSDFADTCVLMQSFGGGLVTEPLISTGVWAAGIVSAANDLVDK